MCSLLFAATAHAETRTETRAYGTALGTVTVCRASESSGIPAGAGGACFDLVGDEQRVDITITDASGPPVQGYYSFLNDEGALISEGGFCDNASVAVPDGSVMLRVYVDGIADQLLVDLCGVGTVGTITASFS